jgi:hypothetical protein
MLGIIPTISLDIIYLAASSWGRVGRTVTLSGPSPDPDEEISTIRLLRQCDSWMLDPKFARSLGVEEEATIAVPPGTSPTSTVCAGLAVEAICTTRPSLLRRVAAPASSCH